MKKAIMLVTPELTFTQKGAREALSVTHAEILQEISKHKLRLFKVPPATKKSFLFYILSMFGFIDGLSPEIITQIQAIVINENIQILFIDGSNLGLVAKYIKNAFKNVKVVTFFHNVETRFFLGAFLEHRAIKYLFVTISNYIAEKSAIEFSDVRIVLNSRDDQMLRQIYGGGATHVSSIVARYVPKMYTCASIRPISERYCLFVGGAFYANVAGIRWFAKNVASNIYIMTIVIGRGFEKYRNELEQYKNIRVIGGVNDLGPWYRHAHFVIAPIFDGSGMKTKVAEALMFGKKVVGSPEAFTGYEDALPQAGPVCISDADYIREINRLSSQRFNIEEENLRMLYELKYSKQAATNRFRDILFGDKS
ncbi:MAG TPA: glycosyltransferase [Methylobacter sp.]|jgi:glycosyltransferase involved in cell wall biosynthesis